MTDQEKANDREAVRWFLMTHKVKVLEPAKARIDPKLGAITEGFSMVSLTDKHRKRNSRR